MFKSFKRFLSWQYRWRTKAKWIRIDGLKVSTDLADVSKEVRKGLYREKYEAPERHLLGRTLKSGDRVLEVGAGIGLVSMTCARICGSENVLSYEPNEKMRRVIEKNFALNGLSPKLRSKALTLKEGSVEFFFADNIYSSSLYDRSLGEGTQVPCDGIGAVLEEFNPNVIVMDIEGAEVDLLPEVDLGRIEKIVVEVHPHVVGQDRVDALVRDLEARGLMLRETRSISYLFTRESVAA